MSQTMPEGNVLIVTGASSGIGRALALAASRRGYAVLAVARRADRLESLVRDITAEGNACSSLSIDITNLDAPRAIVAAALGAFGRIDVLFNNAGMGAVGGLLDQTPAQVNAQWQTHLAAPLRITHAALPALEHTHGHVLFVGSGLARVPAPGYGAYCAAKAAVRAASRQLRGELRPLGIAVTYVDPGVVATEFSEAAGREPGEYNSIVAKPEAVAERILDHLPRRGSRINAVPWQTAVVTLGEIFPKLADLAMNKVVDKPATAISAPPPTPQPVLLAESGMPAELDVLPEANAGDLDAALEPVARRMERLKMPRELVADLLVPGEDLALTDVAMRWAGMPNKNERALVRDMLDALAASSYTEKTGDETWRVLRSP
ncbi:MAG: SDR family NAD(P)-dependent oxidoreductase [Candidatus Eremiobacteraeota bacterium]|nr:SDR family NAD(P)-dependent oxidoreductase [Candidatus Eremiobacteraeota bacterium]